MRSKRRLFRKPTVADELSSAVARDTHASHLALPVRQRGSETGAETERKAGKRERRCVRQVNR